MSIYKVIIKNKNYEEWDIYNINKNFIVNDKELLTITEPLKNKLFSNDTFIIKDNKVEVVNSEIKSNIYIPCVLILFQNKTYGKYKNKLLYKCIPNNKELPIFLVPYEIKNISFNKYFFNLFVTIKYISWIDKHPIGTITNNLGNVDILSNFYEYQLYCKSLNISIQTFNNATTKKIKDFSSNYNILFDKIINTYPNIQTRNNNDWNIFSIDPINSQDFDDAFSIKILDNDKYLLSIYIANVPILLETLDLWDFFSNRISSIYLPENIKKPMLPNILSNILCSLQSNVKRLAFVMDITIDEKYNIENISYSSSIINVTKNFYYDEPNLFEDKHYKLLFKIVNHLNKTNNFIVDIQNSHHLVEYLMIFFNYNSSKTMLSFNEGIFKIFLDNTFYKDNKIEEKSININNNNLSDFINIFNSSSSYINIKEINRENKDETFLSYVEKKQLKHPFLNLSSYIHITSPIRRIVDLLNIIIIQKNLNIVQFSQKTIDFYDYWINHLDFINSSMKNIKKIQNDCSLLDLCFNTPNIYDKTFLGYSFNKKQYNKNNSTNQTNQINIFKYNVYIPEIKLFSSIITELNFNEFELRNYKLFIFKNEDNFKNKIRLQIS